MKQFASILVLTLAPAVFAAPRQTTPENPAPLTSNDDTPRSSSGRATSHDRHARKHRTSNHHHRRHTTARSHNS
jgi:hypothetical protein